MDSHCSLARSLREDIPLYSTTSWLDQTKLTPQWITRQLAHFSSAAETVHWSQFSGFSNLNPLNCFVTITHTPNLQTNVLPTISSPTTLSLSIPQQQPHRHLPSFSLCQSLRLKFLQWVFKSLSRTHPKNPFSWFYFPTKQSLNKNPLCLCLQNGSNKSHCFLGFFSPSGVDRFRHRALRFSS